MNRVVDIIPKAESLLHECLGNKYKADVAKLSKAGSAPPVAEEDNKFGMPH